MMVTSELTVEAFFYWEGLQSVVLLYVLFMYLIR